MADPGQHKLITELGKKLAEDDPDLKQKYQAVEVAEAGGEEIQRDADAENADKARQELVTALAQKIPELVTFAGFVLGKVTEPGDGEWWLLSTDWQLQKWLLIEEKGVVYHTEVDDDDAPFKKRDVVWVKAEASVGTGKGSQSVPSRFLSGFFTRAGDYDAPVSGGTFGAATGIFCEARTPSCCGKKSRR